MSSPQRRRPSVAAFMVVAVRSCLCLILLAGTLAEMDRRGGPARVMAGPNDPPVATVDPNDPGEPDATVDPNDPGNLDPTATFPSVEPSVEATATSTAAGVPTVPPTATSTALPPTLPPPTPTPTSTSTSRPTVPILTIPVAPPKPGPAPSPTPTRATLIRSTIAPVVRPPLPPVERVRTATLRVSGWICDGDGFDPYVSSTILSDFLANCTTAASFTFRLAVYRPGYVFPTMSSLTAGPGAVTETTVSAPATIRLAHLATGFASAVVKCQSDVSGGVLGGAYPDWRLTVSPGETVECTWFAVRPDSEITIMMDVNVCTPDPAFARMAPPPSWELFRDRCTWTSAVLPVQVDLSNDDPEVNYRATPDAPEFFETSTQVVFLDLPPDVYTMTLTPPPGYSHAFLDSCGPIAGFGSPISPILPQTGSPSTYTVDFGAGGRTYWCSWYLVPS